MLPLNQFCNLSPAEAAGYIAAVRYGLTKQAGLQEVLASLKTQAGNIGTSLTHPEGTANPWAWETGRNALLGAGIGGLTGAVTSDPGRRRGNALRMALMGGLIGGGGTLGYRGLQTTQPGPDPATDPPPEPSEITPGDAAQPGEVQRTKLKEIEDEIRTLPAGSPEVREKTYRAAQLRGQLAEGDAKGSYAEPGKIPTGKKPWALPTLDWLSPARPNGRGGFNQRGLPPINNPTNYVPPPAPSVYSPPARAW